MAYKTKKTYSRRKSKINWFNNTKDDSDPFDKLLSSPLKQNVEFKPLSYWENKSEKITSKSFKDNNSSRGFEDSGDSSSDSINKRIKTRWKSLNRRKKKSNLRTDFLKSTNSSISTIFELEKNVNTLCRKCRKKCDCRRKYLISPLVNKNIFRFVTIRRNSNRRFSKKIITSDSDNVLDDLEMSVSNESRKFNFNESSKSDWSDIEKFEKTPYNNQLNISNFNGKGSRFFNLTLNSPCDSDECQKSHGSITYLQESNTEQKTEWNSFKHSFLNYSDHENNNDTIVRGRMFQDSSFEFSEMRGIDTSNETGSGENNFETSSSSFPDSTQGGRELDSSIPSIQMSSLVSMVSDMTISNTISGTGNGSKTMPVISDDSFVESDNDVTLQAGALSDRKESFETSKNVSRQNASAKGKDESQCKVLSSVENNKTYLKRSERRSGKSSSNQNKTFAIDSSMEEGESRLGQCLQEVKEPLDSINASCLPVPMFESTRITSRRENFDKSEMAPAEQASSLEKTFILKSGKQWLRSMSVLRRLRSSFAVPNPVESKIVKGRHYQTFVAEIMEMQEAAAESDKNKSIKSFTRDSRNVRATKHLSAVPSKNELTIPIKGFHENNVSNRFSSFLDASFRRKTLMNHTVKILENEDSSEEKSDFRISYELQNNVSVIHGPVQKQSPEKKKLVTARDIVLTHCGQKDVLPFEEYFNEKTLKNCKKIGEGVFGEVFMCDLKTVLKVIPIEGDQEVNGEPQKKFEEILSEIVIASKLSNLREESKNQTPGFCKMKQCWCVVGKYPKFLINLWKKYDNTGNGSENDSPEMFEENQLYVVLELENGGKNLESFSFTSAEQSFSIFVQTAFSLAVAEKEFEFEHRDLHWGNLLISRTKSKFVKVTLDGVKYNIPTKGVKVSIIDFTLSRILHENCCLFNDLSLDPTLFTSQGCYQFEIYRMMQKEVGNDWSLFRPKTNVFWLHYTIDKMIKMVRYESKNNQIHKKYLGQLKNLKSVILDHGNCTDFVLNTKLT